MFNFSTSVPELDKENVNLFKAATLLEDMGNSPGLTATEFYRKLALSEYPSEDFEPITMAAIAIETMMTMEIAEEFGAEPTVH